MGKQSSGLLPCYGREFGRTGECKACRQRRYCSTAADPPISAIEINLEIAADPDPIPGEECPGKEKVYTQDDLIFLLGFVFSLDFKIFDVLSERFQIPYAPLAELARKKKVSRQAMLQLVRRWLLKTPEIGEAVTFHRKKAFSRTPLPDELPPAEPLKDLVDRGAELTELYEAKKEVLSKGGRK